MGCEAITRLIRPARHGGRRGARLCALTGFAEPGGPPPRRAAARCWAGGESCRERPCWRSRQARGGQLLPIEGRERSAGGGRRAGSEAGAPPPVGGRAEGVT